jgi:hypothetical protein
MVLIVKSKDNNHSNKLKIHPTRTVMKFYEKECKKQCELNKKECKNKQESKEEI